MYAEVPLQTGIKKGLPVPKNREEPFVCIRSAVDVHLNITEVAGIAVSEVEAHSIVGGVLDLPLVCVSSSCKDLRAVGARGRARN